MNILSRRLLSVLLSLVPVVLIMTASHFFLTPFSLIQIGQFGIGTLLVIIGMALFLIGVDLAIAPLGHLIGRLIIKANHLWKVILGGLLLGFFVSIAEPGLLVLSNQIDAASASALSTSIVIIIVSIGMAIMVAIGFLRIIYGWPLYIVLLILYGGIFGLALFSDGAFLALAFDASGATTGVFAVPFILALALGISALRSDSKASEKDSFGLVAIASTGPIYAMLILNLFFKGMTFPGVGEGAVPSPSIFASFMKATPTLLLETFIVIAPMIILFWMLNATRFKLKKQYFSRIAKGFVYTFIGLFVFLLGVNGGFMEISYDYGAMLASLPRPWLIFIIAFLIGALTIIAEPAVYVLTQQISDVTARYIKPKAVYVALAVGVGLAIVLTMVRLYVPSIQLWHLLIPTLVLALALMFFTPKIFVAIAFDAGGVATGPIIVSFVLSFVQGAAVTIQGPEQLVAGFGMISLVAIIPIITLEILGIVYRIYSRKGGVRHVK